MTGSADSPGSIRGASPTERRLQLFRGKPPTQLLVSGAFRVVLYGVLGWAVLRVAFDTDPLDATGPAAIADRFTPVVVALLVLLVIGVIVNVARVVVGVLAVTTVHRVDGVVAEIRPRRRGDALPAWIRWLSSGRRDRVANVDDDTEPTAAGWTVVVDTVNGPRSFVVQPLAADPSLVGRRVRVTVAGVNGYVRKIVPLADSAGSW